MSPEVRGCGASVEPLTAPCSASQDLLRLDDLAIPHRSEKTSELKKKLLALLGEDDEAGSSSAAKKKKK